MNKNGSNQPHRVLVILSSVRDGRHGAKVAQAVMKHLDSYSSLQAEILGKVQSNLTLRTLLVTAILVLKVKLFLS